MAYTHSIWIWTQIGFYFCVWLLLFFVLGQCARESSKFWNFGDLQNLKSFVSSSGDKPSLRRVSLLFHSLLLYDVCTFTDAFAGRGPGIGCTQVNWSTPAQPRTQHRFLDLFFIGAKVHLSKTRTCTFVTIFCHSFNIYVHCLPIQFIGSPSILFNSARLLIRELRIRQHIFQKMIRETIFR